MIWVEEKKQMQKYYGISLILAIIFFIYLFYQIINLAIIFFIYLIRSSVSSPIQHSHPRLHFWIQW